MSDAAALMAFYPQIKWVHVAAVSASGSLFALRGALVQAGRPGWAMAAPLRYASYTIDTVRELKRHGIFRLKPGPLEFLQALVNVL